MGTTSFYFNERGQFIEERKAPGMWFKKDVDETNRKLEKIEWSDSPLTRAIRAMKKEKAL